MENNVTIVKDQWLEVLPKVEDLPMPFKQEIFLLECHVAGTSYVEDIKNKSADITVDSLLTLRRDSKNKYDDKAIAVIKGENVQIGWVPARHNDVISKLMDAGKLLYAKVISSEMVNDKWLDLKIKIFMKDI